MRCSTLWVGPSFWACGSSVSASPERAHLTARASAVLPAKARMKNAPAALSRHCDVIGDLRPHCAKVGRFSFAFPAETPSLPQLWIERIAQPVTEKVHRQRQQSQREPRKRHHPPGAGEQVLVADL